MRAQLESDLQVSGQAEDSEKLLVLSNDRPRWYQDLLFPASCAEDRCMNVLVHTSDNHFAGIDKT